MVVIHICRAEVNRRQSWGEITRALTSQLNCCFATQLFQSLKFYTINNCRREDSLSCDRQLSHTMQAEVQKRIEDSRTSDLLKDRTHG